MNATFERAVILALPVAALVGLSIARLVRSRTVSARLPLIGAACLGVVVFTHVAEGLGWFPFMGWGEPHSAGHYIDLISARLGIALLVAALAARFVRSVNL